MGTFENTINLALCHWQIDRLRLIPLIYSHMQSVNYCMSSSWTQLQGATPVFVDESIFLLLTPNKTRDLDDNEQKLTLAHIDLRGFISLFAESWESCEAGKQIEKPFKALITLFVQSIEFHLQNQRLVAQLISSWKHHLMLSGTTT